MAEQALSRRPEDFPPAVHESLAALRAIAKAAKSKDDPQLRRATAEEIALAEALRKPSDCVGHSSRTGLACTQARRKGMTVCITHGGALQRLQRHAAKQLAAHVPTVLQSMLNATQQTENLNAAVRAGQDWLDRANVGALVQAKVRASKQQQANGTQVIVNIGFLG